MIFGSSPPPRSDEISGNGAWILLSAGPARVPCPYRYVIFDRDCKFSSEVRTFLKPSGIRAVRTSVHSPWQNGVAQRWVGSIARRMLSTHRSVTPLPGTPNPGPNGFQSAVLE